MRHRSALNTQALPTSRRLRHCPNQLPACTAPAPQPQARTGGENATGVRIAVAHLAVSPRAAPEFLEP